MRVYGECPKCKTEIGYFTKANTRVELAMAKGEKQILKCKECGKKTEFHVDDLYKKASKIAHIGAGLIFLIGTPLMFFFVNPILVGSQNNYVIYYIGGLLIFPVIVYGMIKKQDQTRVNSFNRAKLKGRIHNIS